MTVGAVLAVAGFVFAVTGFGYDAASGGAKGVSIQGPAWLVLVFGGVGVLLFGAVWDFDELAAAAPANGDVNVSRSVSEDTTTPGQIPTAPLVAPTSDSVPIAPSSTPTTAAPEPGCRITVTNPFAVIRETAEPFGQEIVKVPGGEYAVSKVQNTTWAGNPTRWLKIQVGARSGWLEDTTFNVEAKSADCP